MNNQMNRTGIWAGIVTYNPDLDRLDQNINAILPQVDKIIIFDNSSNEQELISSRFGDRADIFTSPKNIGIAAALNKLMNYCESQNILWMLSLDQDSVCPTCFVEDMIPYLTIEDAIAIAAPVIIDRNIGVIGHNPNSKYAVVNTCITSGSFVRTDVWKQIAGYDESMFIDSVDFEFCYRVRKAGYKVIQVRDVQLLHELGNSEKRKFLFWKVSVKGHSAFRKYYIAQNNVYYPLKHRLWLHFIRGNLRNIGLVITVLLYENDKKNKLSAIVKGWKNAYSDEVE